MREGGHTLETGGMGRDGKREEEKKIQYQVYKLQMEREELSAQALQDTETRTQVQRDIVALEARVDNVMDALRKSQHVMRDREEEADRLRRRVLWLSRRNCANRKTLVDMTRLVDDFSASFLYKIAQFFRHVVPRVKSCMGRASIALLSTCENSVPLLAELRDW